MIGWKLKKRSLQPIGLDIGHNSIKMIQLAINEEHISILAADKVRIKASMNGDEEARRSFVVSAIKQILTEGKFHGRNVVSCLPNDKLKITSLRLAEMETDGIEQALKKEAGQRFGLDPEKDIINYLVAGNVQCGDEIKNELILFAASDETIRSHIAMLEEVRLRPVAIDTVPCALFRSFKRSRRREEDKEETVVFVDVGSRFTTVVFARGGEISFTKQITIGGEKFNSEIASRLGVSIDEAEILREKLQMESTINAGIGLGVPQSSSPGQDGAVSFPLGGQDGNALDTSTQQVMVDAVGAAAEELAREISLCLRYYTVTFRGKHVERAVFSGGEAYERILLNVLRRHLTAKIEVAQPLKGLDILDNTNVNFDNNRRDLLCEWAVAVGLSLKGWEYQRQL
jgi:type IV pilus assembly protein PilM